MNHLPVAEWLGSLDGIDAAVGDAVAALDRHEARFATVLDPLPAADHPFRPTGLLVAVDDRLSRFDAQVNAASAGAADVDRLLADGVAAANGWIEACSRWRRSLEQAGSGPPA